MLHKEQNENLSRRRFLKIMAAGAAGAVIVSCTTPGATDEGEEGGSASTDTIRVAWGGAPSVLDPSQASADVEIAFLNAIYDYLIDTDADNTLVPRLATDWEVNEEGTVYTLTIAEGVTFHNGDPLTLDDVMWTLERLGSDESSAADLFGIIETMEADGNTLTITLSEPDADFLYTLADNRALILQANAEDIGYSFNGTGPFRQVEYITEDRAILEAKPDYFAGAPTEGGLENIYFPVTEAAVKA
ncbi:MAG: ABC transporter substrate-binding protein, partial [Anaerolineae bacterium]